MEKLYISYAENRRLYGTDNYHKVSRFVKEIPDDCLEEIRIKNTVSRPTQFGRAGGYNPRFGTGPRLSDSGVDTGLKLGQRVLHSIFGEGIVVHFEGSGPSTRVQINFDDEGSKWLVLQYAKLEPL